VSVCESDWMRLEMMFLIKKNQNGGQFKIAHTQFINSLKKHSPTTKKRDCFEDFDTKLSTITYRWIITNLPSSSSSPVAKSEWTKRMCRISFAWRKIRKICLLIIHSVAYTAFWISHSLLSFHHRKRQKNQLNFFVGVFDESIVWVNCRWWFFETTVDDSLSKLLVISWVNEFLCLSTNPTQNGTPLTLVNVHTNYRNVNRCKLFK